jgi:hypothetical protein
VTGASKHSNEHSGSMKDGEIQNQLSEHWLLKDGSALWSQLNLMHHFGMFQV